MSKNLVIVESPAKAKTIEKYLGKDFTVKSSFGHVRDLPKKNMSIDIEGDFTPTYEISTDKKKVITELRRLTKTAETVWLATDEDREGEAISWHLFHALKLKDESTKRITFNEITKSAILKAIEKPRKIDVNLVDAQQARRVLDRLVGYELSPVLWKKVRMGLSAGRVQSVAVRLVVDREREIEAFESVSSFKVIAEFVLETKESLSAELTVKLKTKEEVRDLLEKSKDGKFEVVSIEKKPSKKSPSAPFTTSTLQQEASKKLGYSVKKTMMLAQRLYESGKITYMRTDSVSLSGTAIKGICDEITKKYGEEYVQNRAFKNKNSSAQEAHEAIRPTHFNESEVKGDPGLNSLYKLIWKRTMASQMADAKIDRTVLKISLLNTEHLFKAEGEILKFPGFLTVYMGDLSSKDKILPPLEEGESLDLEEMSGKETFSRSPARFTEATLVRALEEKGIGRPSTYAPTISTIQARNYVEKKEIEGKERKALCFSLKEGKITEEEKTEMYGADKGKMFPTDTGNVVTDFLVKYFSDVIDYSFTAHVEEEFDRISQGKESWNKMIAGFYEGFHKEVVDVTGVSREEAVQSRELGIDPKSKRVVLARLGRFGPMIQLGHAEDTEKPKFASMPDGFNLNTVTLDAALTMFALPKTLGKTKEGEEIIANVGRFGPYVKVGKLFVSIKPHSPFDITLEQAFELIEEKKKAEKEKYIKTFEKEGISVLNGRYGPYITDGKKNAKIPKDVEPKDITLEQAQEILAKYKKRKR
jgi:DNA topoisomerase I